MAIIEKLHILRFRNLDNQYLEPHKNINLFVGGNGQGKTNLIEALYYLGHNRSFKSKNISEEEVNLTLHEIGVELDKEISEKSNFESNCKYVNIEYSGSDNSILNYELMEGLSNGNNFVWGINYNNKLKNNLLINLQYSGRKSETSDIKHIGNMGITAYF